MGQLYRKLKEYSQSEAYPFHMPGHKRRLGVPEGIREIDITEIDGFDNLHHAEGILKEAQQRAAKLYGAEETYYLVNGSTAGILAAISACVGQGGKLLMARNSHKAAYHAAEVRALKTVYLYPQRIGGEKDGGLFSGAGLAGSISPADVRRALENDSKIEAVFLTSPTYDGIVSDIKEIAGIAHSFGVPLIVDEAHGAHFGFHPYFPESSVRLGADIVIHSLHKTLPSMTQTALLHQNGVLVKRERIQKYLDIYQTSSPSYVMMACMDGCIEMLRQQGDVLFEDFAERLEWIGREADGLKHIHLLRCAGAKGSRRADAKERQR
ncbi:MAG: aminotransferase class V-fold PLP-dependent enzyme, partial [Eubacteriales bacterium]|nr:aminotransferase class V-fold PLP-dependent enzyme [Eubacteriales bacterium]